MAEERLRVYTVPGCLDCAAVKALLRRAGVPFEEVDVSQLKHAREALALLSGRTSLPQVFLGGRFIGQVGEVRHLLASGELQKLVRGSGEA